MEIEKPNKIYLAELCNNGGCYPEWRTQPYEAVYKNHEYIKKEVVEKLLKDLRKEYNDFYFDEDMNRGSRQVIDRILEKIEEI